MEFSSHELEVPLAVWVYPVLGVMEAPPAAATDNAKNDVKKALQVMEDRLKASAYLAGDFVSLADIVLVCALKEGFTRVFDPAFRKPFPKVSAWFETCCGLPQFSSVLGKVALCAQAQKPQAVKAVFAPPARGAAAPAPAAKKDDKKAAASAPAAKEAAAPKAKASAAPAPAAGGALTPAQEAEIKKVGDAIRELKEKLKGEGLSGGKINKHPEIEKLVNQLTALKSGGGAAAPAPAAAKASPKAAPAAAPAAGGAL